MTDKNDEKSEFVFDSERSRVIDSKALSPLESLEIRGWLANGVVRDGCFELVYSVREYKTPTASGRSSGFCPSDTFLSIRSILGGSLSLAEARSFFDRISNADSFYSARSEHERHVDREKVEGYVSLISGDSLDLKRIWSAIPTLVRLADRIQPNTTESSIHKSARHSDHDKCIVLGWNTYSEVVDLSIDSGSYFLMDDKGRFYEQRQRTGDDSSAGKCVELREHELLRRVGSLPSGNFANASRVADRLEKLVRELGGRQDG